MGNLFAMSYSQFSPKVELRREVRVREVWRTEPEFSDFLATEEGVKLIGNDLGLEIENLTRECRGNDFPCDILGNIVGEEQHQVLIENQYGRTDHDHLGKFLTYAASHNALTCIWIAERVTDDHRSAVDWLNDNTPESFRFFAAELRAFCIGDSAVAPMLSVICEPNLQIKIARSGGSEAERLRYEWRRKLWEDIHEALMSEAQSFRVQKAGVNGWSTIRLGKAGICMNMLLTPRRNVVGIETILAGPQFEAWFDWLHERRPEIEAQIGSSLEWVGKGRAEKRAKILLEANINPRDDDSRQSAIDWFCEMVPKWHAAFAPLARQLPDY